MNICTSFHVFFHFILLVLHSSSFILHGQHMHTSKLLVLKLEYSRRTRSISWMLMLCSLSHQVIITIVLSMQPFSSIRKDFNYLHHLSVEKWQKISVNALWPSDTIWQYGSGSPLPQVRTCCLTAASHYMDLCWLLISKVLWHSHESNNILVVWKSYF